MMKTRKTRLPLDPRLSISDGIDEAQGLWAAYDLDEHTDTQHRMVELAEHCDDAGIADLEGLAAHAPEVIKELADVPTLAAFVSRETAARINEVGNTIRALLLSAGIHRGEDPAALMERLPTVPGRSVNKRRALGGDEILLLRLEALQRALKGGRVTRFACQYALIEIGATTSEIEHITLGDFNDHIAPTTVLLPGNETDVAARTAPVSRWASKVLAVALNEHIKQRGDNPNTPVAYLQDSAASNPNPAAAVCTNIARAMTDLGLGKGKHRPEPHSILRWRLKDVRSTSGVDAAHALSGRSTVTALYTFLSMEELRTRPAEHKKRAHSMLGQ
jgi:hypothetical protein